MLRRRLPPQAALPGTHARPDRTRPSHDPQLIPQVGAKARQLESRCIELQAAPKLEARVRLGERKARSLREQLHTPSTLESRDHVLTHILLTNNLDELRARLLCSLEERKGGVQ